MLSNNNSNNKKYLYIGLAILVIIFFLVSFKKNNNNNNSENCCGNTDFNKLRNDSLPKIINFDTEWCGFSKQFKPVWNSFMNNADKEKIKCENINCDENPDICQKYNIRGYPTVKLVKNDTEIEFDGRRTVDDLNIFINKNI